MNWKQIILSISISLLSIGGWAQPQDNGHHGKSDKIKAMKVAYITSKLDLTTSEAEKFWPIYNEMMTKMHRLQLSRRKMMKESHNKEYSDAEINDMIKRNFEIEQEILDLKMEYDIKFKKVLPIQKVGKLYLAEHEFRKELVRKMRHSSKNGHH